MISRIDARGVMRKLKKINVFDAVSGSQARRKLSKKCAKGLGNFNSSRGEEKQEFILKRG